jgi:hypothetical protein
MFLRGHPVEKSKDLEWSVFETLVGWVGLWMKPEESLDVEQMGLIASPSDLALSSRTTSHVMRGA